MKELMSVLEGSTNVEDIYYSTTKKIWVVFYKNKTKSDEVESKDLIEFLENA